MHCNSPAAARIAFNKESDVGLYLYNTDGVKISYEDWRLVYFMNLDDFLSENEQLYQYIMRLESICDSLQERKANFTLSCKSLADFYYQEYLRMKQVDSLTESFDLRRYKRSAPFSFIGKIHNVLYGVADEDTVDDINEKIDQIIEENKFQETNFQEQTTIIESNLKLERDAITRISNRIDAINATLEEFESEAFKSNFNILMNLIQHGIEHHTRNANYLYKLLTNVIDTDVINLISVDKIIANMKDVERDLKSEFQIYTENITHQQIFRLLQMAHISGQLSGRRIMIIIKFPILEREIYNLYKSTPVPLKLNNKIVLIRLESKALLMNSKGNKIIYIPQEDLQQCKRVQETLICKTNAPILHNPQAACETKFILNPKETSLENCVFDTIPDRFYVIKLVEKNRFFIFTNENFVIQADCNGQTDIIEVNSSGVLAITPGCSAVIQDYTIRADDSTYEYGPNITLVKIPFDFHIDEEKIQNNNVQINDFYINGKADPIIKNFYDQSIKNEEKLKGIRMKTLLTRTKIIDDNEKIIYNIISFSILALIIILYFIIKRIIQQRNVEPSDTYVANHFEVPNRFIQTAN